MNSAIRGAPGVYRIALGCSNAYVLSGNGGFALVDTGTPWDKARLARALRPFGGARRCVQVILTHAHPDHAGCAALVAQASRAPVLAHENERPFLEASCFYGRTRLQKSVFRAASIFWPVRPCRLSIALSDGDTVETPAGAWRVVHTPGHTSGHISLWRESDGVLISGDALLNILPWTRRPGLTLAQPIYGEDQKLAMQSALRLAKLQPRVLLVGHGAPLRNAAEPLRRFAQANA